MTLNDLVINMYAKGAEQVSKAVETVSHSIKKVKASTHNLSSSMKFMGDHIISSQKQQERYWEDYFQKNRKAIKLSSTATRRIKELKQQGQLLQPVFAGWAMSIMFFGMTLQRVFQSIWKSGTSAFQEISHSVDRNITGFDLLQGSMKYLGFTIGQALEPVTEWLIPIIDRLADWVSRNEEVTRSIVVTGIAVGTLMFAMGTLTMVTKGFQGLAVALFGIKLPAYLVANGGLVGILKTKFIALKAVVASTTAVGALGFLGMIGGIILALMWIWKLKEAMGGWGEFAKSVLRGVFRVYAIIFEAIFFAFRKGVEGVVWVLNKLIDAYNKVASKLGLTTIGNIKIDKYTFGDGILSKYLDWEQDNLSPEHGYAVGRQGAVPIININNMNVDGGAQGILDVTNSMI